MNNFYQTIKRGLVLTGAILMTATFVNCNHEHDFIEDEVSPVVSRPATEVVVSPFPGGKLTTTTGAGSAAAQQTIAVGGSEVNNNAQLASAPSADDMILSVGIESGYADLKDLDSKQNIVPGELSAYDNDGDGYIDRVELLQLAVSVNRETYAPASLNINRLSVN